MHGNKINKTEEMRFVRFNGPTGIKVMNALNTVYGVHTTFFNKNNLDNNNFLPDLDYNFQPVMNIQLNNKIPDWGK